MAKRYCEPVPSFVQPGETVTIYGLIDPRSQEVRYVGKTAKDPSKRLKAHISKCRSKAERHQRRARWIASLVREGLRPTLQTIETLAEGQDWAEAERKWISIYREVGPGLLNHADGGEGPSGSRRSDESKAKIVAAIKSRIRPTGWSHPAEVRQKISQSLQGSKGNPGCKHTPEGLARIAAAARNQVISDDTRAKLSAAKMGHFVSEETRRKISERRRLWIQANPEKAAEQLARLQAGRAARSSLPSQMSLFSGT